MSKPLESKTAESKTAKPSIGFLTAVRHETFGLFGGFLVLNTSGRPLEFHCTAPVKPSRAEEILFGVTLDDFLFGEQIGSTLVRRAQSMPELLCTDLPAMLAVSDHVPLPIALVLDDTPAPLAGSAESESLGIDRRFDAPHRGRLQLTKVRCGLNWLAVPLDHVKSSDAWTRGLALVADEFDLREPFDRIRAAIDEAQRGSLEGRRAEDGGRR